MKDLKESAGMLEFIGITEQQYPKAGNQTDFKELDMSVPPHLMEFYRQYQSMINNLDGYCGIPKAGNPSEFTPQLGNPDAFEPPNKEAKVIKLDPNAELYRRILNRK